VFEHTPLRRLELVETSREQRLETRRNRELGVRSPAHRQHLGDEQRVAARGAYDLRALTLIDPAADEILHVGVGQGLEPKRDGPAGAAIEQLRPSHAKEQDRSAGGEQGNVLDQIEERLLAPLNVIEHADERGLVLEQLAEGPGDLLRARPGLGLAEHGTERSSRGRIGRKRIELLDEFDYWPIRDALAVRETPSAD